MSEPRILQLEQNGYTQALAFCVQTANPRFGSGAYGSSSPGLINAITGAYMNPMDLHFLTWRGRSLLGQKFSLSRNTVIYYNTDYIPYIYTSDQVFSGDFAVMIVGNPAVDSNYNRWLHQGHLDFGATSNLAIMGNYSSQAQAFASGKVTFLEYNGFGFNGYADTGAILDGLPHCYMFTRIAGVHKIFVDGVDRTAAQSTSLGVSIGGYNTSTVLVALGGAYASSEDRSSNCTMPLFVAWNRAVSDSEAVLLSNNPFLLFKQPSPVLFGPSSISQIGRIVYLNQAVNRAATW